MSNELNIDHEVLDTHLAKVELGNNDFAILGVRPTQRSGWVQVAVAQKIAREGDIGETVVKNQRIEFRIGRGDEAFSGSKPQRAWDHLTYEDAKVKYANTPEVISAAEQALKSDDYVLVSDENGKPIVNPTLTYKGMELPYNLDIWEDHQPENEWSVKNMKRAAKQTPEGLYLFKNRGGTLSNGTWIGGENFAIFRHFAVQVCTPDQARREYIEHSGAVQDLSVLKVVPATAAASGFNGIAGTAETSQKQGKELDQAPETTEKQEVNEPTIG